MSTKTFSLPGMLGFSAPVVRSEHRVTAPARTAIKPAMRRPAITRSRVRNSSLSSATKSVRAMTAGQSMRNWLGLSLAVGTGLIAIVYVLGVNSYAATGYEIQKEQVRLNQLQEENKKLLVKTAEIGSIAHIQNEALVRNLVAITSEEYLQPNHLSQR